MQEKLPSRRRSVFRGPRVLLAAIFLPLVFASAGTARAQEPAKRQEFWPEINVFINLKPKVRLFLLATASKSVEDGEIRNAQSYEAQFGVHVDYIVNKHLILRTGYRYGTAVGNHDDGFREHRLLTGQILRKLLPGGFLLSDRNQEDFRFIKGDFSFRYRNRVTIERELRVFRGRTITPYASGEVYYDTRYHIWNRNRWVVGLQQSVRPGPLLKMLLPKRQIILDLYFARQNDSRSSTPHVDALGAVLAFHF